MTDDLVRAAIKARAAAYAPYSSFHVGAAMLDEAGNIHTGANVENAAYPAGLCAEAGALSAMIAAGGRKIIAVAVAGPGEALCTPCGICRQRIREFAAPDTRVLVCNDQGLRESFAFSDLLPASFGPENLD